MLRSRRRARSIALQALYEIDCAQHSVADALARLHNPRGWLDQKWHEEEDQVDDQPVTDEQREFVYLLVNGILDHLDLLDALIQEHAPEWPVDQIAIIDRNVLRMAVYEFGTQLTPIRVAINEAVELAKDFGSDAAPRFVNGVLGSVSQQEDAIVAQFMALKAAEGQDETA